MSSPEAPLLGGRIIKATLWETLRVKRRGCGHGVANGQRTAPSLLRSHLGNEQSALSALPPQFMSLPCPKPCPASQDPQSLVPWAPASQAGSCPLPRSQGQRGSSAEVCELKERSACRPQPAAAVGWRAKAAVFPGAFILESSHSFEGMTFSRSLVYSRSQSAIGHLAFLSLILSLYPSP